MKHRLIKMLALSAMMAITPITDASAHWGHGHGHGGRDFGIFALGAAVVGATAVVLSAPFNAIAQAGAPEPEPYYPQPQAYQQAPQPYYAPPPQAYYAPPQAYYAPAPVYYAPAPRGYYRY